MEMGVLSEPTDRDREVANTFQKMVFEQVGVWISDEALAVLSAEIERGEIDRG
jgi:hypothetical protein